MSLSSSVKKKAYEHVFSKPVYTVVKNHLIEVDYSEKCFAANLIKRFWSCGRKLSYKSRGKEAAHCSQPFISQILSRASVQSSQH